MPRCGPPDPITALVVLGEDIRPRLRQGALVPLIAVVRDDHRAHQICRIDQSNVPALNQVFDPRMFGSASIDG